MKNRAMFLAGVATLSLLVTSVLFWFFEHGRNPAVQNGFDVVWWWITTSATVGYGDIVPLTWQGRVVAIGAILSGFFIFTSLVAIIAEAAHERLERHTRGTAQVRARGHIVICEYTAIADELIQSLPQCPALAKREVAIVSDLVVRNPYPQHHFVCSVPISPAALKQANIGQADYVFIFANQRFAEPDVKTLHTAARVLNLNSHAMVFVELMDPHCPLLRLATRPLVPMDSRKLIERVLRHQPFDPNEWISPPAKAVTAKAAALAERW